MQHTHYIVTVQKFTCTILGLLEIDYHTATSTYLEGGKVQEWGSVLEGL